MTNYADWLLEGEEELFSEEQPKPEKAEETAEEELADTPEEFFARTERPPMRGQTVMGRFLAPGDGEDRPEAPRPPAGDDFAAEFETQSGAEGAEFSPDYGEISLFFLDKPGILEQRRRREEEAAFTPSASAGGGTEAPPGFAPSAGGGAGAETPPGIAPAAGLLSASPWALAAAAPGAARLRERTEAARELSAFAAHGGAGAAAPPNFADLPSGGGAGDRNLAAIDRAVRRDARRYDNGYEMY
jgi:hypothetical protein